MGRRRHDAIDLACLEWGRARRQMLGLDDVRRSVDILAPMRSTLGQRRDLHSGSRSNRLDQHWPEVYGTDSALVVAQAYARMREELRAVMDAHYVARGAIDDKAEALAMCRAKYFHMVSQAKHFVEGWMAR